MIFVDTLPKGAIDWKAFEVAVDKINKRRALDGAFITLEEARKKRNYDKFIEADIHIECPTSDRKGYNCCGSSEPN